MLHCSSEKQRIKGLLAVLFLGCSLDVSLHSGSGDSLVLLGFVESLSVERIWKNLVQRCVGNHFGSDLITAGFG